MHRPNRAWVASLVMAQHLVRLARDYKGAVPESLEDALDNLNSQHWRLGEAHGLGPITLAGGPLYPYQAAGVRWLEAAGVAGSLLTRWGWARQSRPSRPCPALRPFRPLSFVPPVCV